MVEDSYLVHYIYFEILQHNLLAEMINLLHFLCLKCSPQV